MNNLIDFLFIKINHAKYRKSSNMKCNPFEIMKFTSRYIYIHYLYSRSQSRIKQASNTSVH